MFLQSLCEISGLGKTLSCVGIDSSVVRFAGVVSDGTSILANTGGSRSFLYVKSVSNAPTGAVNIMEITAAVSIILPQGRPSESAIAPIDACTVAFGRYDGTIKSFSFALFA